MSKEDIEKRIDEFNEKPSERLAGFHPRRTGGKDRAFVAHVATPDREWWRYRLKLPARRYRLNVANVTR